MKVKMAHLPLTSAAIVLWTLLVINCSNAVAIPPSTFGGVVDSFGRLTNSIKVNLKFNFMPNYHTK